MTCADMKLSIAGIEDAEDIMKLANEAYSIVEDGCTGSRFKKGPRFSSPTEGKLLAAYQEGRVFKVTDSASNRIVGMTYWEVTPEQTLYFGPFAVSPAFQGRKIGKMMMAEVERIARERHLTGIDIKVIHLRTDLVQWYMSKGYVQTGTSEYPPENVYKLTQPAHFIDMRRILRSEVLRSEVHVAVAKLEDAEDIMNVVNEAYSCENGCTGFGHKNENRMICPAEGNMASAYQDGRVLKAVQTETGQIVGMMYWEVTSEKSLYFGPYAVSPTFQGRKIGKLLLSEVERIAQERQLTEIKIVVVNVRTDLISMYTHLGFVQTGTAPFPPQAVYKLTRDDVHIIEMSRPLQRETVSEKSGNVERKGLAGGCFCGKVRYQITSCPTHVYFCHCSICRRISGSVVMAWLSVPSTAVEFATPLSDDINTVTEYSINYPPDLASYETSACFERWFCRTCASHIMFSRRGSHSMVEICHGSLDAPASLPPRNHIWTENQLSFLHLNENIPKFATEPSPVRVFRADDFSAVRKLWQRGLMDNTKDSSLRYPPSLVEEETQFISSMLDQGDMASAEALSAAYLSDTHDRTSFWVYESDGVVIGCVGLRLGSFPSGEISRFGVDEKHRGLGIGSKLLEVVESFARNVGYTSLTATTVSLNVPAVHCYAKAGYKDVFRGRQDGNAEAPDFVKLKKDLA